MKNLNALWNGTKNFIYKRYAQESGKMIVHAGVITWITATASQVFAIAINKKVADDQKKFLIPQEIADGALNLLAFYLVTNSLKNISGKLASTGKWSTKAIRNFVKTHASDIKMGDMSINLGERFKNNEEFHTHYDQFKSGLDMMAAVAGSVSSCNIVTPIIRNKIGAHEQKQSIERDKINSPQPLQPKIGMKI